MRLGRPSAHEAAAFLGAFLAFHLELLASKTLLPVYGGSAAVWTGAVMFFQAVLLAGYVWCWAVPRRPAPHLALLAVAAVAAALPDTRAPAGARPLLDLLARLGIGVAVPFFVLSMTTPTLQAWAALGRDEEAYSVFAASNAGAFAALIAYPLILEPTLDLPLQFKLWRVLFVIFAGAHLLCLPSAGGVPTERRKTLSNEAAPRRGLMWVLLAAAPCGCMLAVTQALTLDFAAMPLLWVLPLAVYLATLFLNFKRRPWCPEHIPLALAFAGVLWLSVLASVGLLSHWLAPDRGVTAVRLALYTGKLGLQLGGLFFIGMACHRRLSLHRPTDRADIPRFYVALAAGGWLGSAWIALGVPLLGRHIGLLTLDGLAAAVLALASFWACGGEALGDGLWTAALAVALCAAGASRWRSEPGTAKTLYAVRNFYGVYAVEERAGTRGFFHGNTRHGLQLLDPAREGAPMSYFHPGSPLGQAFQHLGPSIKEVGVVGLGIGTVAAYAKPGQHWDFYELDPDVAGIARDYFSYLKLCKTPYRILLGDARLSLEKTDATYDLLVLDAFHSDAMPVHLMTQEAVGLYLRRLSPHGILLMHISNRFLDFRAMLAGIARSAGISAFAKRVERTQAPEGERDPSTWVALARDKEALAPVLQDPGWEDLGARARTARPWTDRCASPLSVLAW